MEESASIKWRTSPVFVLLLSPERSVRQSCFRSIQLRQKTKQPRVKRKIARSSRFVNTAALESTTVHALQDTMATSVKRNVFAKMGVSVWTSMGLVNAPQATQGSTVSLK